MLLTVSELLLLGLEGGREVERVEDAAWVAALVRWQAVALEDGVLVDAAGVLDVLPPPDLDVVEQDELDDEERGRGREVLGLAGVVPLRRVDEPRLGQHLRDQHTGHTQHRPPPVHQLRLHEPPKVLRVLRQAQRVEAVVTGEPACTHIHRYKCQLPCIVVITKLCLPRAERWTDLPSR
jgi:hypothetical protein